MAGSIANRLSQFLKNGGSFGDINLFDAAKTTTTTTTTTTMDLFPSSEGKGKASKPQTVGSSSSSSAQMTIFYGGQVIVLDGFPSDKAMEIMDAAKSASSSTSTGLLGGGASDSNRVELQLKPEVGASAAGSSSDMPIARKVSLRRFLEKRKDRVATRAPYQMNKPVVGLSRPEESRSMIDLEATPSKHHLELSL